MSQVIGALRLLGEPPSIGEVYDATKGIMTLRTAVFDDMPYFDRLSVLSEPEERDYFARIRHLPEDHIVWDEQLIQLYLSEVSGDCSAYFYERAFAEDLPGYNEGKWDLTYLLYDSSIAEVYSPHERIIEHLGESFPSEPTKYPSLMGMPDAPKLV